MPKCEAPNGLRGTGIRRREPAMVGAEARVNIQPSIDTESTAGKQGRWEASLLDAVNHDHWLVAAHGILRRWRMAHAGIERSMATGTRMDRLGRDPAWFGLDWSLSPELVSPHHR